MAQTALKTTYKDYVPPTEGRKYRITQLEDGLCTIEDVTDYLQQGDTFGAEDINCVNRVVNDACADFSMEEDEMPYRWIDGKTVYRMVLRIAPAEFTEEEVFLWMAEESGNYQHRLRVLTKTGIMSHAKAFLPMSCACSISNSNGGSFRALSYARPEMPTYAFGWRLDKNESDWNLVVNIGALDPASVEHMLFVLYYTK